MRTFQFFDFEVYPTWWCVILGDYVDKLDETVKETFTTITSETPNYILLLKDLFFREGVVNTGYNIKYYDNIILNAVLQGYAPEEIKDISDMTIDPSNYCNPKLKFLTKRKANILYQDMFDDGTHSLKANEGNLGLSIVETDVDFNKVDLTEQDKLDIIKYCKHDVYCTMELYRQAKWHYIRAKEQVAQAFDLDMRTVYRNTNAGLCSMVLGASYKTYYDGDDVIRIPERIRDYVLNYLPTDVINRLITDGKKYDVKLFGNAVTFGSGGLHSVLSKNLYVESTKDWALINLDVASFYPSIMIQLDLLSRSVANKDFYPNLFKRRMYLKHKVDATPEEKAAQFAYKLILNTAFGASGSKWLPMYDQYMQRAVCANGQLLLASFAVRINNEIKDLKIIQGNTDGILVYVKRTEMARLRTYIKEWEEMSNMLLEEEEWTKIWQRDVNNYIAVDNRGKNKVRGGWVVTNVVSPDYGTTRSLSGFVTKDAIVKHLTEGVNVVKYILGCNDLHKFVYSANKGSGYSGIEHRHPDGTVDKLNKCNRVIATKDKTLGTIVKTGTYKGNPRSAKVAGTPENCMLVNNDLRSYDFNEIKKSIDYHWYLGEVYKNLPDENWSMIINDNIKPYNLNF